MSRAALTACPEANLRESKARTRAAFGFGGWHIEVPPSRKAKKRQDDELYYAGVQGRRERAAKMVPPLVCRCGCGTLLPIDPYQKGPKRQFVSKRHYLRAFMRAKRAGAPWARTIWRKGEA